ncbi:MAG: hypothetical protein AAFS03_07675 [Pseudomonadota bacterium]
MAKGFKTGGRQKGTPNRRTVLLKDAVLEAAERAGDEQGMVGFLEAQARENPAAFLTLLGKVLPQQVDANLTRAVISHRPLTAEEWAERHAVADDAA